MAANGKNESTGQLGIRWKFVSIIYRESLNFIDSSWSIDHIMMSEDTVLPSYNGVSFTR